MSKVSQLATFIVAIFVAQLVTFATKGQDISKAIFLETPLPKK